LRPRHVSIEDIRAVDRIVFECLELWHDPVAWQTHLLERAGSLLGLPVGLMAEVDTFEPGGPTQVLSAVEAGWQSETQRQAFFGGKEFRRPQPFESPLDVRLRRAFADERAVTRSRADLMPLDEWTSHEHYQQYWAPAGLCESVMSARQVDGNDVVNVLYFAGNGHVPGPRERTLLGQIHKSIAAAQGERLTTWKHISPLGLTPRQVDVFRLLVTGLREQDIARDLHRSPATINEHVASIYRHFGVSSRGELLGYLLARSPMQRRDAEPPGVVN